MPDVADASQRESYADEYVELRPRLESRFRKRFPTLRGQESDFYNEAWESLLRSETTPESLFAYLERALYTRGLNELRRRARRPADQAQAGEPTELDQVAERTAPDTEESVVADIAAAATQRLLLDRLSPRQARVIKLHYGWGLTVPEVAAALAVSRRTVRREVEEAAPRITENAEWLTACQNGGRRSLVRAYVLGFLGASRAAKAAAHLEACPGCRALRDQMEETLRGVAAAVPAALVVEPPGFDHSVLDRIAHAAAAAREQVVDLAGAAKQQATALVARAPATDTASQVAAGGGLRGSGAMLATAAGCLVLGGGTVTYCAVEGVPEPVRAIIPGAKSDDAERSAEAKGPPERAPDTPPPEQVVPVEQPPAPAPVTSQPAPEPDPTPPAEEEFGIEQTGPADASASSATESPAASSPTPAPSSGGSEEFGFER